NHLFNRGRLYFDRFTSNGASTGLRFMGNVEDAKATIGIESIKVKDFTQAAAPTAVEAVTATNGEFSCTLREFDKSNLANFFIGAESSIGAQTSGSFNSGAPDAIVVPSTWPLTLDRHLFLTKKGVSALVVKDSAQTTTYVANTDYVLQD